MSYEKFIYFLKPIGMTGPIKIGCSQFTGNRLLQLSVVSPFPLEIIYSEPGDHVLERKIHRCFGDIHSHNEWFHPHERLLAVIEQLKAGVGIASAIDLSDDRGSILAVGIGKRPCLPGLEGYRSYSSRARHAAKCLSREMGGYPTLPDDISEILSRWYGHTDYRQPRIPRRPSAEEFARLDEYIGGAAVHPKPTTKAKVRQSA